MFYLHITREGVTYLRFARTHDEAQKLFVQFAETFNAEPVVVEREAA